MAALGKAARHRTGGRDVERFRGDGHAAAVFIVLAGLQRGMPLLILPFVSKVMTPAEFGASSMLTASALLLVTVVAAPLEALVFRLVARADSDRDSPSMLKVAAIYCYVAVPIAVGLCAAFLATLNPTILDVSGVIWSIELLAIGLQPAMTYYALPVVQASKKLGKFSFLAGVAIAASASSKLLLVVVWKNGVLGWAISDLISASISAAAAIALVRPARARIASRHIRAVASFAVPLIPHRVSFWAISSLSRPSLALVSTLTQVGLLSLGLNIASVANLLLTEINRALLPRYSKESFPAPTANTHGPVRLQLVLAAVVPSGVGSALALCGDYVFEETYWPSFALCGVLLLGQTAYGLYLIPTNYIVQAAGETRAVAVASGAGAATLMILLLVLGSSYGAFGAAYATAFGFLAMSTVAAALTRALRLSISWCAWRSSWLELTLGLAALCASVIAVTRPVGSQPGRLLAVLALILAASALAAFNLRGRLAA